VDIALRLVYDTPLTWINLLSLLFLGLARIFPLFVYAPFLGANILPNQVKVAFSLCLWAIILPKLLATTQTPLTLSPLLLVLVAKEFLVGMVIGFLAAVPFQVANTSGMLIDNQRGTGAMAMRDPTAGTQASPIGGFYNQILIVLFYAAGGPIAFLSGFFDSYNLIPADGFLNVAFFQFNPFWKAILQLFGQIITLALQLAAPPFLAMLMTDLFLGIVNRLAPQVQISFLGMSLKSLVACVLLFFGWTLIINTTLAETQHWMGMIPRLLQLMAASPSS
jgi:type III secretion protein T